MKNGESVAAFEQYFDEQYFAGSPDWCYVVQHGQNGPLKIGHTGQLGRRMAAIQTHCPEILNLVAVFMDGRATERRLHALLNAWRLRGEWFNVACLPAYRQYLRDADTLVWGGYL